MTWPRWLFAASAVALVASVAVRAGDGHVSLRSGAEAKFAGAPFTPLRRFLPVSVRTSYRYEGRSFQCNEQLEPKYPGRIRKVSALVTLIVDSNTATLTWTNAVMTLGGESRPFDFTHHTLQVKLDDRGFPEWPSSAGSIGPYLAGIAGYELLGLSRAPDDPNEDVWTDSVDVPIALLKPDEVPGASPGVVAFRMATGASGERQILRGLESRVFLPKSQIDCQVHEHSVHTLDSATGLPTRVAGIRTTRDMTHGTPRVLSVVSDHYAFERVSDP